VWPTAPYLTECVTQEGSTEGFDVSGSRISELSLKLITKMSLLIRKASLQDAADIASVHVVSWQESYRGIIPNIHLDSLDVAQRTDNWKARLDPKNEGHYVFVAILEGQLCGFVGGGAARSAAQELQDFDGEIYAIYVLQAAKGKGIGRLLMRKMAETLQANEFKKAMLWVLADNPTRGFYEHLGGQEIKRKIVPIAGVELPEIAYGWQDLRAFF
jgi:ribosomal protein S18 acetylase RimI-like enzyme